jgi:hypothetical protein
MPAKQKRSQRPTNAIEGPTPISQRPPGFQIVDQGGNPIGWAIGKKNASEFAMASELKQILEAILELDTQKHIPSDLFLRAIRAIAKIEGFIAASEMPATRFSGLEEP